MRKLFSLLAAAALISFTACSNDSDSPLSEDEDGNNSISVTLTEGSIPNTRAAAPGDIVTANTIDIDAIALYVTDNNNTTLAQKTITKDETVNSDWYKLTSPSLGYKFVNVPKTASKVFVVGNPSTGEMETFPNRIDFTYSTTLDLQHGAKALYFGYDDNLTPIVNEPIEPDPTVGQTYTAIVSIAPVVARLQIRSITFKPSGTVTVSNNAVPTPATADITWTSFSGSVKGIYLNNFYYKYNTLTGSQNVFSNATSSGTIVNGNWLFNNGVSNAADYASYNIFTGGDYQELPLNLATLNKAYAFNMFPGAEVPNIHLYIDNIVAGELASSNPGVYNPEIMTNAHFFNITKFYRDNNVLMTAEDFKAGKIYNMDLELVPVFSNDLTIMQYNVVVRVTIEPWTEETITPGFELEE